MGQYNATAILRDEQVAQEIRSMAALGKFPKEITVYGLVYYCDDERKYMISADSGKLIAFLNETANTEFFPTPIEHYSKRLAIPEGYEEEVVQSIKLEMAKKLQQMYPAEAFALLKAFAPQISNDTLDKELFAYRDDLESEFDKERINAFLALCSKAYIRKNLSSYGYRQLVDWCHKRLRQLESYIPPSSNREKRFYGMVAIDTNGDKKCCINGNLTCIYEEKSKLEVQYDYVSIWHQIAYDLDNFSDLRAVQQKMQTDLLTIYDSKMIALMKMIEQAPSVVKTDTYKELLDKLKNYGEKPLSLGKYYGRSWGITSKTEEVES